MLNLKKLIHYLSNSVICVDYLSHPFQYLDKLIQCISLSRCVIQIHGGVGHYAGAFSKNIINLKIKNENLQKLYKIQTKGSYLDLYISNSQKFESSITSFLKKIS